ncbi:hypothetical protein F4781DRAFT_410953 [Annulohypoxylon bovei var. microspora]|nr:hypothetical protein F4781DRAFT_410953 [Annulohypoxylon bovei var. microspora]
MAITSPHAIQQCQASGRKKFRRIRAPSPYPWPSSGLSPNTSPTRVAERHIQFDLPPSADRGRSRPSTSARRAPSPYPSQGVAQSEKEQNSNQTRKASEKKAHRSFWQSCFDFESSFLTLVQTAYDTRSEIDSEDDVDNTEKN